MSHQDDDCGPLSIILKGDEAIVLFDLLGRWVEDERGTTIKPQIRDSAEFWVLNSLYCSLESVLVAPVKPHYAEALDLARSKVRERFGGEWVII